MLEETDFVGHLRKKVCMWLLGHYNHTLHVHDFLILKGCPTQPASPTECITESERL